jgi:hypothetical protein
MRKWFRLDGDDYASGGNMRCRSVASLVANGVTNHATERADQRGIPEDEMERIRIIAAENPHKRRVVTADGTVNVVSDGVVVTIYRKSQDEMCPLAPHVASHNMDTTVGVPRCVLDHHGRDIIRRVEAELNCCIHVPVYIDRREHCVFMALAVTGAPLDRVERRLRAALGPWKVIDDIKPNIIIGPGGRTIKLLRTLVPGCRIECARKGDMCGDKQDNRTVLQGTSEQIEATHSLIRKLWDSRNLLACPACGETFANLKKGRTHVSTAHAPAACHSITDDLMRDAGFDRLQQILLDSFKTEIEPT